jgi:hypothetical protein
MREVYDFSSPVDYEETGKRAYDALSTVGTVDKFDPAAGLISGHIPWLLQQVSVEVHWRKNGDKTQVEFVANFFESYGRACDNAARQFALAFSGKARTEPSWADTNAKWVAWITIVAIVGGTVTVFIIGWMSR